MRYQRFPLGFLAARLLRRQPRLLRVLVPVVAAAAVVIVVQ